MARVSDQSQGRPGFGIAQPGNGRRAAGVLITVIATAGAMGLGQKLWPNPVGAATPPASLLPLFIGLELAGALLFGLGICFLAFGYSALARARQPLWATGATYVSIAWLLLSWWPHGNLHRVTTGADWGGLLRIDYGFHLTLMASALVVALFFLRVLRSSADAR